MNPNAIDLPLRDIHLPDPISWWPLAIGWWIVLALVIILGLITFFVVKRKLQPTLKKEAVAKLASIEEAFIQHKNPSICLTELSALMRSVIISQDHSKNVAGLTGKAWLEFLDKSLEQPEFSQGVGKLLLDGPYRPVNDSNEVSQLIQLCHKWVQRL